MMKNSICVFCLGLVLLGLLGLSASSAEPASVPVASGTVFCLDSVRMNSPEEKIAVVDLLPLLNRSVPEQSDTSAPLSLVTLKPGESLSPDAIRPFPEVIYLLEGTAEITADDERVVASAGDGIFVPAGSVMMVTATGNEEARLFSICSADVPSSGNITGIQIKTAGSVSPTSFGNESSGDWFEVTRLFSPYVQPLPLSFDLAVARLPAGNVIADHFVEAEQVGYVLSGEGLVTLNCIPYRITAGDLLSIPANIHQRFEADEEMEILLITSPYYTPGMDHAGDLIC